MTVLVDVAIWICLLGGGFFTIVGGIGLLRLPDFFTRIHAAGITDTLGAGLIVTGLALDAGYSLITVKLLLFFALLLLTSPTATHALAQAALYGGRRPLLEDNGEGGGSSNS